MSDNEDQPTENEEKRPEATDAPQTEAKPPRKAASRSRSRVESGERDSAKAEPKEREERSERSERSDREGDSEGGGRRGRGRRSSSRGRSASGDAGGAGGRREPVDLKAQAKMAWQLYRADVAEEGLELVKEAEGRKLAQRSFDLARVFLEEKARHAPKE